MRWSVPDVSRLLEKLTSDSDTTRFIPTLLDRSVTERTRYHGTAATDLVRRVGFRRAAPRGISESPRRHDCGCIGAVLTATSLSYQHKRGVRG